MELWLPFRSAFDVFLHLPLPSAVPQVELSPSTAFLVLSENIVLELFELAKRGRECCRLCFKVVLVCLCVFMCEWAHVGGGQKITSGATHFIF